MPFMHVAYFADLQFIVFIYRISTKKLLEKFMFRLFYSLAAITSFGLCSANLYAVDPIDVRNICNAHFPKATEERANKVIGYGYEALHAANTMDEKNLRRLLFTIKSEVEGMMSAQVKFEAFVDDAFAQAAQRGAKFTQNQINNVKMHFGIYSMHNGFLPNHLYAYQDQDLSVDVANLLGYKRYEDQKCYNAPPRLNAGVSLVIIGGIMTVIPFPPCSAAGVFIAEAGMLCILDACITGCERQEGYR